MSRGAPRAGAGQGAAAAVQLLVTLSFLPSVVEAQVSPGDGGAGTPGRTPAVAASGPRLERGEGRGRTPRGFWRAERAGAGTRTVTSRKRLRTTCGVCEDGDARGVMAVKRGRW